MKKIMLPEEEIYEKSCLGQSSSFLAAEYGVSSRTIQRLVKRIKETAPKDPDEQEATNPEEPAQEDDPPFFFPRGRVREVAMPEDYPQKEYEPGTYGKEENPVQILQFEGKQTPAGNRKVTVLVDTENDCLRALENLLLSEPEIDRLVLYQTTHSRFLPLPVVRWIANRPGCCEFVECVCGTPNALDFQIVTDLGRRSALEPDSKFYVVTNDGGFDHSIRFLNGVGVQVSRVNNHTYMEQSAEEMAFRTPKACSCLLGIFAKKYGGTIRKPVTRLADYLIARYQRHAVFEKPDLLRYCDERMADALLAAPEGEIRHMLLNH